MTDTESKVAVMLADVSGSTALYEAIGNAAALDQVSSCLDLIRRIVAAHGGQFIHSRGDDVLSIFDDPNEAVHSAIEMLNKVREGPLSVHAGIAYGPVIRTPDDVFGDSVNMAARLASLANTGEVLCNEDVFAELAGHGQSLLRFFDSRHFKGKTEYAKIYSYSETEPGQETELVFVKSSKKGNLEQTQEMPNDVHVRLQFLGISYLATVGRSITIGRSSDCDLVVADPRVSRNHASLEIQNGHVYLKDTSSAGTYICFGDQTPILARRETVLLPSSCKLSLARDPDEQESGFIECLVSLVATNDPDIR